MKVMLTRNLAKDMDHKVPVIRAIRSLTRLSLREAKPIADSLALGNSQTIDMVGFDFPNQHTMDLEDCGIYVRRDQPQGVKAPQYVQKLRNLTILAIRNGDYSVAHRLLGAVELIDNP